MLLLLSLLACAPSDAPAEALDTGPFLDTGPVDCQALTYEGFGEAFMLNWCMSCHSSEASGDARYGAPADVNLDTHEGVLQWRDRVAARVSLDAPTMPPVGGAGRSERARLLQWLECGAP